MDIELIDKAWACLPKEFKEEVKEIYLNAVVRHPGGYNHKTDLLKYLFGHHNLTSDAEEEEILSVPRKAIIQAYEKSCTKRATQYDVGYADCLYNLFGSKCLPGANEDNFVSKEPKPAEPKNEGTSQEQCVPKNAESGTHSFNHILKDGFRNERRLNIAAMAMQGILSNADRMKGYEHIATTPPCEELTVVVARNALRYADELIRQSGKGDSK